MMKKRYKFHKPYGILENSRIRVTYQETILQAEIQSLLSDISAWISNDIHHFQWDITTPQCANFGKFTAMEVSPRVENYIPWLYVDVYT